MTISFNHVHIKTRDVAKTVQYYIDNFGATKKAEMPGRGWQLDLHGTQLNITTLISNRTTTRPTASSTWPSPPTTTTARWRSCAERRRSAGGTEGQQRQPRRLRRRHRRLADGNHRKSTRNRSMALKDLIPFGMSLPHRSPDPIDMDAVRTVATRAEALGFRDLWVTENTLDHVTSFDPVVVLTYAAAVTTRIRLGASVLVLPVHDPRMVAHQWASLDYAQQRPRDHGRRHRPAVPLPGIPGPAGRPRRPLPRTARTDPSALEPGESHPSRPLLPPRRCQTRHPAGAEPAADLDGRRPPRCHPPRRHDWPTAGWAPAAPPPKTSAAPCRCCAMRWNRPAATPPPSRSRNGFSSRSTKNPEVAKAELHRWYTEVYHNPSRHRYLRHPRHPGTGPRTAAGNHRHGRQPPAAEPGLPPRRTTRGTGRGRRPVADAAPVYTPPSIRAKLPPPRRPACGFPDHPAAATPAAALPRHSPPISPRAPAGHDRDASHPTENYDRLRAEGFLALTIAQRSSAARASTSSAIPLAYEALGQGCPATALAFNMHASVVMPLLQSPEVTADAANVPSPTSWCARAR